MIKFAIKFISRIGIMKFKNIFRLLALVIVCVNSYIDAEACTSAIVSAKASETGKPFIWKHRDTDTENNYLEKISTPGNYTFIALFNSEDEDQSDAWMGMNEAGFMIMNTASYNLAPDTAQFKDREGVVMRRALETCRTFRDFTNLLDTFPQPMGIQANFGIIDRNGDGGYVEADDYNYTIYPLSDTVPYIVRTNYSFSGNDTDGYGYIRYDNACHLMGEPPYSPWLFTEGLSRSFYHSKLDKDMAAESGCRWVIDQDFIPRRISSASIVMVNGLNEDEDVMYATLGYAPTGELFKVTFDSIPVDVMPIEDGRTAPACNRAKVRKSLAFPIKRGSGSHYIDMEYLRPVNAELKERNMKVYEADFGKK